MTLTVIVKEEIDMPRTRIKKFQHEDNKKIRTRKYYVNESVGYFRNTKRYFCNEL